MTNSIATWLKECLGWAKLPTFSVRFLSQTGASTGDHWPIDSHADNHRPVLSLPGLPGFDPKRDDDPKRPRIVGIGRTNVCIQVEGGNDSMEFSHRRGWFLPVSTMFWPGMIEKVSQLWFSQLEKTSTICMYIIIYIYIILFNYTQYIILYIYNSIGIYIILYYMILYYIIIYIYIHPNHSKQRLAGPRCELMKVAEAEIRSMATMDSSVLTKGGAFSRALSMKSLG